MRPEFTPYPVEATLCGSAYRNISIKLTILLKIWQIISQIFINLSKEVFELKRQQGPVSDIDCSKPLLSSEQFKDFPLQRQWITISLHCGTSCKV